MEHGRKGVWEGLENIWNEKLDEGVWLDKGKDKVPSWAHEENVINNW